MTVLHDSHLHRLACVHVVAVHILLSLIFKVNEELFKSVVAFEDVNFVVGIVLFGVLRMPHLHGANVDRSMKMRHWIYLALHIGLNDVEETCQ